MYLFDSREKTWYVISVLMCANFKNTGDLLLDNPSLLPTPSDSSMTQRYRILTRIGSGGMGDVFLGIQRGAVDFQRLIVLKRIHAHLFDQPNQQQMFVDEASLVASLDHPHIVKIIDFRKTENSFYIVMEYVDGETLKVIRSMCQKKHVTLPFPLACKLILSACEALHYAHNATSRDGKPLNIIHRDIGLHNLMIDRNGYLKVIDFGIAKSNLQTDKTHPGMLKGNPSYMAPDIFRYNKIDKRVDIYATGLCLYELLTQQRAFNFEKDVELAQIIQQVTLTELPAPSSIVSSVPTELDAIVLKATAKNRDQRYQSVADLASDLRGIVSLYRNKFERYDMKEWFYNNFAERIQDRIQFEQNVVESAKNTANDKCVSIYSYPPPPPGATEMMSRPPTPSSIQQIGGIKPMQLLIIIGCLFLFSIASVTLIYLLFIRAPEPVVGVLESQKPNLFIQSAPVGADVYVDGKRVGVISDQEGSFWISPDNQHLIDIKKAGFSDYTLSIAVPKDGQRRINASLKIEATASNVEPVISTPKVEPIFEPENPTSIKNAHKRTWKKRPEILEETNQSPAANPAKPNVAIPLLDESQGAKVPLLDGDPEKADKVPLI